MKETRKKPVVFRAIKKGDVTVPCDSYGCKKQKVENTLFCFDCHKEYLKDLEVM